MWHTFTQSHSCEKWNEVLRDNWSGQKIELQRNLNSSPCLVSHFVCLCCCRWFFNVLLCVPNVKQVAKVGFYLVNHKWMVELIALWAGFVFDHPCKVIERFRLRPPCEVTILELSKIRIPVVWHRNCSHFQLIFSDSHFIQQWIGMAHVRIRRYFLWKWIIRRGLGTKTLQYSTLEILELNEERQGWLEWRYEVGSLIDSKEILSLQIMAMNIHNANPMQKQNWAFLFVSVACMCFIKLNSDSAILFSLWLSFPVQPL